MSTIIELYNRVSAKVQEINNRIDNAERKAEEFTVGKGKDATERIEKLMEQLTQVEEYLGIIRKYQNIALKNLTSMNVSTIEAPPGYRVNLNRLRNWLMMIDTTAVNDPYAQRVYITAKCDEHFLCEKKKEFTDKLDQLINGQNIGADEIQQEINSLKKELESYLSGEEVKKLAEEVKTAGNKHWFQKTPYVFADPEVAIPYVTIGAYYVPLLPCEEQRTKLKELMGDLYDENSGMLMVPIEVPEDSTNIIVCCSPDKKKELDKAIENLFLDRVHNNPAGSRRFYLLDAVRYNAKAISDINEFEDSYLLNRMARTPQDITSILEQIVSDFEKTDKTLGNFECVGVYNADNDENKTLPSSTIVVYGWPNSFSDKDKELLTTIMNNQERYGISVITITFNEFHEDEMVRKDMPGHVYERAIHIDMTQDEYRINLGNGDWKQFVWYSFGGTISFDYAKTIKEIGDKKIEAET